MTAILFALAALVVFLPLGQDLARRRPPFWRLVSSAGPLRRCDVDDSAEGSVCGVARSVPSSAAAGASCVGFGRHLRGNGCAAVRLFCGRARATDVWFANYLWPATTYSAVNAAPYGFPVWENVAFLGRQQAAGAMAWIVETASVTPFLMIAGLPLLVPASAALSGRHWFRKATLPYWLAAYALFIAELHRMDMGHLRNGAVLLGVMLLSICEAERQRVCERRWVGRNSLLTRWRTHEPLCDELGGRNNADAARRNGSTRRGCAAAVSGIAHASRRRSFRVSLSAGVLFSGRSEEPDAL